MLQLKDLIQSSANAVLTAQNISCPVNRLPVELLTKIFECIMQDARVDDGFTFPLPKGDVMRELVRLNHVCRFWRQIFTSSPHLFSTLHLQRGVPSSLVEYFLRHSSTHPLTVYATTASSAGAFNLISIAQHADRLQHLQLDFDWDAFVRKDGRAIFHKPAPLLERFDCCILPPEGLRSVHWPPALPRVFDGSTPRLRQLRLSGFSSFPVGLFRDLTHICIEGWSSFKPAHPLGFGEVINLLRDNPRVEEVYLSHIDTWVHHESLRMTPDDVPENFSLELMNLRRLSLCDCTVAQLGKVFKHLQLTRGTILSLTRILDEFAHHTSDIFVDYQGHLDNLADLYSATVDLSGKGAIATGLSGALRILRGTGFNILRDLLFCSPFRSLRELWIRGREEAIVRPDWSQVLTRFPLLEKLCIDSTGASYIISALSFPSPILCAPSQPDGAVAPPSLCKHLQTLWIIAISHIEGLLFSAPYSSILSCVQNRSARRSPIRHLRIYYESSDSNSDAFRCDPEAAALYGWSEEKLGTLRQYVDVVELGAGCLQMEISQEFKEGTHPQFWPRYM